MSRPWRDQARCVGLPMTAFFPCDRAAPGSAAYWDAVWTLRADYCWRCPVRTECLRDGMSEDHGVWGGTTPEDRRKIVQLDCLCGAPLDPKDIVRLRANKCTNCADPAWLTIANELGSLPSSACTFDVSGDVLTVSARGRDLQSAGRALVRDPLDMERLADRPCAFGHDDWTKLQLGRRCNACQALGRPSSQEMRAGLARLAELRRR